MNNHLGTSMRAARVAAGLTCRGLAAKLGWSVGRLGNYEAGTRTPQAGDLVAWARAVGVSPGAYIDAAFAAVAS